MNGYPDSPRAHLLLAAALLCAGATPSAVAQKTYRCGSTYQSFPCAGTVGAGAATKGATVAAKPGAPASASAAVAAPAKAPAPPAMSEEEKKAAATAAAAAEQKAKCDKIRNDLNYNRAQQKSGGSKTTMDRLAGERKQIEADLKREACTA